MMPQVQAASSPQSCSMRTAMTLCGSIWLQPLWQSTVAVSRRHCDVEVHAVRASVTTRFGAQGSISAVGSLVHAATRAHRAIAAAKRIGFIFAEIEGRAGGAWLWCAG